MSGPMPLLLGMIVSWRVEIIFISMLVNPASSTSESLVSSAATNAPVYYCKTN